MKYAVLIEKGPRSYGAYVPDLPGCIATGDTREAVTRLIRSALRLHIQFMRERGDRVPRPTSHCAYVEV